MRSKREFLYITRYYTNKESGEANLYFPLATEGEDFYYAQLLHYFLERRAAEAGLNFYTMLSPMESVSNAQEICPQFMLGLYGESVAESLTQTVAFLQSEDAWNADELAEYIKTAPQAILDSYYDRISSARSCEAPLCRRAAVLNICSRKTRL